MMLKYKSDLPISIFFSDSIMKKLNSIFSFLLRVKQGNLKLSQLWKSINNRVNRRASSAKYKEINSISVLLHRIKQIYSVIIEYIWGISINVEWEAHIKKIASSTLFQDILSNWKDLVTIITKKCFLEKKSSNLLDYIYNMMGIIHKLHKIVLFYIDMR
jgi:Gamma tubulin complex component C-terminal